MKTGTWIAIYLPIFILLFVILPSQRRNIIKKTRKKRGNKLMANELIKKYIGKNCTIYTGTFGSAVSGQVVAVEDNWIEVSTKRGSQVINTDFVTNISENPDKKKKTE